MTGRVIAATTREEWLANRRIGASNVAAILGVDPYQSAYAVWGVMCGLVEPEDLSGNEAVEFGIRLQGVIAEAYSDRTNRVVQTWPQYDIAVHSQYYWLRCTPDATQTDEYRGTGLVEIKTTGDRNADDWTDEPPLAYQCQVQAQMAITGYDWGTIVCLIGGNRLKWFDLERNDEFISAMLPKLEHFWGLVQRKVPPEVDSSDATTRILARLYARDDGELVVLPQDADRWTDELFIIREKIKELETRKTLLENLLKASIGNATYGLLPDGSRWSWKLQERKGYTVEPTSFRVLRKLK